QIKSGKSLDLIENDEMMVFDSSLYDLKEIYSPSIILLDALLSMLSKPQSEILREIVYDRDASISEIAERLGKSKQVVYKTIKRGAVDKIIKFLDAHLSLLGMRFF
ncbi:winged helix-turn-helix transcriptional regulator, partial [Klebsiella pneumoniae]